MKPATWASKLARLYHRSPTFLLAAWFLVFLLAGTILLALPVSQRPDGPGLGPLGALFTATSAFCVTGLALVDTQEAFTPFGQFVILVLIELGGAGIMTFASLAFSMVGRRLSMIGQAALTDTLFQNDVARRFTSIFRDVLKAILFVQLAGVVVLYLALLAHPAPPEAGHPHPLWSALFHSVSAFCNAGFSIYRNNLTAVTDNGPFLAATAVLVVLGGLGHAVLAELFRLPGMLLRWRRRPHRLSFNSRVVLLVTGILLAMGAAALAVSDLAFNNDGATTIGDSVFHSVIARTAGFNSAPMGALPVTSCLILCMLMFVGGSPGSCAGGIKTTSLAIWLSRIGSNLRHADDTNLLGYTIARDLVSRSRAIIALSTLWVIAGVFVLSIAHPDARLEVLLFEQVSALATVGLSMDFTPHLNWLSQLWIIASMILGKFGPLTVALWMVAPASCRVRRPEVRLMIG